MSHSAVSIADSASVKMPAGPAESPAASAQLAHDRLDAQRVLADGQRAEFIDGGAQRAGHGAAVERQADALDAAVGLHAQDDDRDAGGSASSGMSASGSSSGMRRMSVWILVIFMAFLPLGRFVGGLLGAA